MAPPAAESVGRRRHLAMVGSVDFEPNVELATVLEPDLELHLDDAVVEFDLEPVGALLELNHLEPGDIP